MSDDESVRTNSPQAHAQRILMVCNRDAVNEMAREIDQRGLSTADVCALSAILMAGALETADVSEAGPLLEGVHILIATKLAEARLASLEEQRLQAERAQSKEAAEHERHASDDGAGHGSSAPEGDHAPNGAGPEGSGRYLQLQKPDHPEHDGDRDGDQGDVG